jgi:hypothetical protein
MKKETPDGLWAITSFFNPMACCRVQINQSYTTVFLFGTMIDDHLEWDARIML